MRKRIMPLSSVLLAVCLTCSVAYAQHDTTLYTSAYTQSIIKSTLPQATDEDYEKLLSKLTESLENIDKHYEEQVDPLGLQKLFEGQDGITKSVGKGIIKDIPWVGSAVTQLEEDAAKENADRIQPFINERLFGQTSALNSYFASLRDLCNNDVYCIRESAKEIGEDPRIRDLLGANPGMVETAKLNELITNATVNATLNQGETIRHFDSQDALIKAFAATLQVQLSAVIINEQTLINNTAQIIHTQQLHTIALTRIQSTIDANQAELRKRLDEGFGTVVTLQAQNIFLTEMVLEHTQQINQKLDVALEKLGDISEDVNTIRARQLDQIFNESPLAKKLKMLEGATGKELMPDEAKRNEMIENVKIMLDKERIVAITKKVREWGLVSIEALNVFYPGAPPELKQAVSVAITASDIIGGVATGNWSQAIMSGLSLFKNPTPGPEMQMLQHITEQLTSLQTSMNAQFKQVYQQLFSMEQNLVARLEIVDQKLDIISRQIEFAYTELSEQLLSVNSKLSYVVKQNECTQDLILDIFRANNSDICAGPVREFKKRVTEGSIHSLADLEQFFIGQQCKNCIEALFNNASQNLLNSQLFRYTYCNPESMTESNRPDNMYDYVFNYLVPDSVKGDPVGVFGVMQYPDNIIGAASIRDSIRTLPDSIQQKIRNAYSSFVITDNDRHYRHYMAVVELADYALTLMPFLELYNDGGLMTTQMINAHPEITRERSKKIIDFLDNLSELIDHTVFQQSLMAGVGSFASIDKLMAEGDVTGASGMTLGDVFRYNPLINKNYSAYFMEKKFGGLKSFQRVIQTNPYTRVGKYYQGGNDYELVVAKDADQNVIMQTNWSTQLGKKPIFQAYIPGVTNGVDTAVYHNNLLSAVPQALPVLLSAKKQINLLSAEMKFIISDELDKPGAPLTRKEFDRFIQTYKTANHE